MPLNPNGKTDRAKLPPPPRNAGTGAAAVPAAAAPRASTWPPCWAGQDDLEDFLAEQWRAVLHLEDEVGHDDNFFDLGGHSLLVPQLLKKLEGRFPQLRLLDLFRFPTITKMAEHLRGGPAPGSRPGRRGSGAGRPAVQSREIAIVGVAGRFPGAADVEAMWRNVLGGVEAIGPLDDAVLLAHGVDADSLASPDYVKRGAVLDGIAEFDADFFAMNAREAQITDPQHRLFLETAWEALERAGWAGEGQDLGSGGRVGVFAGVSQSGYFLHHVLAHPELLAELGSLPAHLGTDKDFLPTRVAYKLDLTGPAFAVQTACSTSLVAVHLACRSLLDGECDLALAGGATVQVPHADRLRLRLGQHPLARRPLPGLRRQGRRHHPVERGGGGGLEAPGRRGRRRRPRGGGDPRQRDQQRRRRQGRLHRAQRRRPGAGDRRRPGPRRGRRPAASATSRCHGTGTQLGDPIEVAALEKVHRRESADSAATARSPRSRPRSATWTRRPGWAA